MSAIDESERREHRWGWRDERRVWYHWNIGQMRRSWRKQRWHRWRWTREGCNGSDTWTNGDETENVRCRGSTVEEDPGWDGTTILSNRPRLVGHIDEWMANVVLNTTTKTTTTKLASKISSPWMRGSLDYRTRSIYRVNGNTPLFLNVNACKGNTPRSLARDSV